MEECDSVESEVTELQELQCESPEAIALDDEDEVEELHNRCSSLYLSLSFARIYMYTHPKNKRFQVLQMPSCRAKKGSDVCRFTCVPRPSSSSCNLLSAVF